MRAFLPHPPPSQSFPRAIREGDFHQIPPIVIGASAERRLEHLVHQSPLWPRFTVSTLRTSVRMASDQEYSTFVDGLCTGEWDEVASNGMALVPSWMGRVEAEGDALDFAFPDLTDPSSIAMGVIMCTTHCAADAYNSALYDRMPGATVDRHSYDTVDPDHDYVSDERLVLHRTHGVPPRVLRVRQGAVYGIMRNLSPRLSHHTLVVVESWTANLVCVRVIRDGVLSDDVDMLPRINFEFDLTARIGPRVVRRQFPLYFYGATTINACQGRTVDRAVADVINQPFDHGQAGVVFSRVRSREAIRVRSDDSAMFEGRIILNNVVVSAYLAQEQVGVEEGAFEEHRLRRLEIQRSARRDGLAARDRQIAREQQQQEEEERQQREEERHQQQEPQRQEQDQQESSALRLPPPTAPPQVIHSSILFFFFSRCAGIFVSSRRRCAVVSACVWRPRARVMCRIVCC